MHTAPAPAPGRSRAQDFSCVTQCWAAHSLTLASTSHWSLAAPLPRCRLTAHVDMLRHVDMLTAVWRPVSAAAAAPLPSSGLLRAAPGRAEWASAGRLAGGGHPSHTHNTHTSHTVQHTYTHMTLCISGHQHSRIMTPSRASKQGELSRLAPLVTCDGALHCHTSHTGWCVWCVVTGDSAGKI